MLVGACSPLGFDPVTTVAVMWADPGAAQPAPSQLMIDRPPSDYECFEVYNGKGDNPERVCAQTWKEVARPGRRVQDNRPRPALGN